MTFDQIIGALILAAPVVWLLIACWPKRPDQSNSASPEWYWMT